MPKIKKETPNFFEEIPFDPVVAATGPPGQRFLQEDPASSGHKPVTKKKVGFYISKDLLERFNRKFHELKLSGVNIENKSALLAVALSFTLDDMDRGDHSHVLKCLQ
jgi:hypothetical protein